MQDGTEALPLLFDVPHMLKDSIKYMISGCDVMLNEMEQEMGRLHGVMQLTEQQLTLFNGFPQVREKLGETCITCHPSVFQSDHFILSVFPEIYPMLEIFLGPVSLTLQQLHHHLPSIQKCLQLEPMNSVN